MTWSPPARTSARPARSAILVAAAAVVVTSVVGTIGYQSAAAPTSPDTDDARAGSVPAEPRHAGEVRPRHPPDSASVVDDGSPAVAGLDPDLLGALRHAATDASDDGVTFVVNSGRRSPEEQDRLLRAAISQYGSEAEAARWVATPDTSPHVSGDAIDIGPTDAAAWLSDHGAAYGLCQTYDNEPWHYELRRDAGEHGCPPRYADPTHDPRMQQ